MCRRGMCRRVGDPRAWSRSSSPRLPRALALLGEPGSLLSSNEQSNGVDALRSNRVDHAPSCVLNGPHGLEERILASKLTFHVDALELRAMASGHLCLNLSEHV